MMEKEIKENTAAKGIVLPYSQLELTIALSGAAKIMEGKEEEVDKKLDALKLKFSTDNKMKATADFIGISLTDLINSPNMNSLINHYEAYQRGCILDVLTDLGLSKKEAWAVFIYMYKPELLDMEHENAEE